MEKKIKIGLIVGLLFLGIICLAIVLHDYQFVVLSKAKDMTWVEIEPHQCGDWRVPISRDIESLNFPLKTTISKPISPQNFEKINVTICDIKKIGVYSVVCDACSCPEGYRLYLLVSNTELKTFLDIGYKISNCNICLIRKQ